MVSNTEEKAIKNSVNEEKEVDLQKEAEQQGDAADEESGGEESKGTVAASGLKPISVPQFFQNKTSSDTIRR